MSLRATIVVANVAVAVIVVVVVVVMAAFVPACVMVAVCAFGFRTADSSSITRIQQEKIRRRQCDGNAYRQRNGSIECACVCFVMCVDKSKMSCLVLSDKSVTSALVAIQSIEVRAWRLDCGCVWLV